VLDWDLEGVQGIKEIFVRHSHTVMVHLSTVFETVFAAIVDEVRLPQWSFAYCFLLF